LEDEIAMTWTLRRWQAEALPIVIAAVRKGIKAVISAFMGSGKSVFIAALIAACLVMQDRTIIVAAPRATLVRQLSATMVQGLGEENVGVFYASKKQFDRRVVVTTYQSMAKLATKLQEIGRKCQLLICDECHGTEARSIKDSIEALEKLNGGFLFRIGLTATPFRSVSNETLSLWDEVVYRYGWKEGLKDGVIVPWKTIRWDGQDFDDTEVDRICLEMLQREQVWPTLANADNIEDAEKFAAFLSENGIPAKAIHNELRVKEQDRRLADLKSGQILCLVHVDMLSVGADFPWLRGLLLRRKVGAKVRFVQEVGRVLRAHPGKTHGTIFDPYGLLDLYGLDHDDAIGEVLEDVYTEVTEEGAERANGEGKPKHAVAFMPVGTWLQVVCDRLQPHGLDISWKWIMLPNLPAQDHAVKLIRKMIYFIRWLPDEKARKRFRGWCDDGRISRLTQLESQQLIALLRFLAAKSEKAREYKKNREFWKVSAAFEWPRGVELPVETPGMEDVIILSE
jgi:superfamily II DNA or RNA helicase